MSPVKSSGLQKFSYFVAYKPYGVLSQFSSDSGKRTLADIFSLPRDVYPVGRLDEDSEGLILLTNDNSLKTRLLSPGNNHPRTYIVQLDGEINSLALNDLTKGVNISVNKREYLTKPASARFASEPDWLPERIPPVRFRKTIPTSWIEITLTEGKNRQIRKMTASVGFPTLRLIRISIGNLKLAGMDCGSIIELRKDLIYNLLFGRKNNKAT